MIKIINSFTVIISKNIHSKKLEAPIIADLIKYYNPGIISKACLVKGIQE